MSVPTALVVSVVHVLIDLPPPIMLTEAVVGVFTPKSELGVDDPVPVPPVRGQFLPTLDPKAGGS